MAREKLEGPWQYVVRLLKAVNATWWVVVPGLASVGAYLTPANGLHLSTPWVAVVVLSLGTLSVGAVAAYRVRKESMRGPAILRFVQTRHEEDNPSPYGCTFIVRAGAWRLRAGHLVGLYRTSRGEEVCIGILAVMAERADGNFQCAPVWIGSGHLLNLNEEAEIAQAMEIRQELPVHTLRKLREARWPKHEYS